MNASETADSILGAFSTLLETVAASISETEESIRESIARKDYEAARQRLTYVDHLNSFQGKLVVLHQECVNIASSARLPQNNQSANPSPQSIVLSKRLTSARRGRAHYYRPVLGAQAELGGAANLEAVLTRVETLMTHVLTSEDYETVDSGTEPKWRNRARWARSDLVEQGLILRSESRGIWEISQEGQDFVQGTNLGDGQAITTMEVGG